MACCIRPAAFHVMLHRGLRSPTTSTSSIRSFAAAGIRRLSSCPVSAMEKAPTDKGVGDHMTEQEAKQSFHAKGAGRLSDSIIQHILNLYASTATARDFEIYAPNATFEDPLMCAHGVKQIKSSFYSLPKVFSESKIVEYTIQENVTAPGSGEILIDNKQYYKVFGKDVDVVSLIRLHVEGGKIVRHEDWWDKKPLRNRDTVTLPLVGRLAEVTRRGSMFITHALMGFGKDPSP